jgi:cell wall-associated NlpC family hydrolase
MSIDAVESRIGQIISMQQQLSDPSSALAASNTSSSGGVGSAGSALGTTGSSPTSFSDALSSALATNGSSAVNSALSPDSLMASTIGNGADSTDSSSLTPALSTLLPASSSLGLSTGSTVAGTAGAMPTQVQAMTDMANSLVGKPYVYGGGHGGWGPQSGYDCSGFVSAVLHAGGYLSQPVDTTALPQQAGMEAGPGQYVTVYDRALPGQSGHVIIQINGQFYESGGSHGAWGGGGGVEKIATPSASYLASFPTVLHPAGL